MATKKKTEDAQVVEEVTSEVKTAKKSTTKKSTSTKKKAETKVEEPVAEVVEEPKVEEVKEPAVVKAVEEPVKEKAPKVAIEAAPAPVKETKQVTTEKVAEKKATSIMAAPTPAKKPETFEPYTGVVTPKIGIAVFKGPGFVYGKAGSRPCGTHLLIHEVIGNFGKIGTDKWVNLDSIEKI